MNNDQNPERFEDRLLGELNAIVEHNPSPVTEPAPARRKTAHPTRRFALASGMAMALAAAAAVIVATGDPESAYAVDKADNGSISVEVRSLSDADGLEAKLRAAGVDATVNYNTGEKSKCGPPPLSKNGPAPGGGVDGGPSLIQSKEKHVEKGDPGAGAPPPVGPGEGPGGIAIQQGKDGVKFTIKPGSIPDDAKLIIDANTGSGLHSLGVAVMKGAPGASGC
jgi:hypothetical protein